MRRRVLLVSVFAAGAALCGFVISMLARQGLAVGGAWAGAAGGLAGVVAVPVAVWAALPASGGLPVPVVPVFPPGAVGRPSELDAIVAALRAWRYGAVGITAGLYGAGGFGKTTLAVMVCADRRVRRRFGKFVYPVVTLGRDVRGPEKVAARVNDVIKLVSGEDATYTDPGLAGARLGSLLDARPRRLLVIDDVWDAEQLKPFMTGGRACARLVTTRMPGLLDGQGASVRVDQMSAEQAEAVLTAGLSALEPTVVQGLLAATGRWPLLLHLVNKILAGSADLPRQARLLLGRLAADGPAAVDDLLGEPSLDVGRPDERVRAVRATIEASTGLLTDNDAKRFAELSVFAEDEVIPAALTARLWHATAGLDELDADRVRKRLLALALVSKASETSENITIHDVVLDFLRAGLTAARLTELNSALLDAVAAVLPSAAPFVPGAPAPQIAWWELDAGNQYMWDHLIEHLVAAGRRSDAESVACDLRWAAERLKRYGPTALTADLAAVSTLRAERLRAALARTAHLFSPTDPPAAVIDILCSHFAADPDWGPQAAALQRDRLVPRLVNRWPLPDQPRPDLRRVLTGHKYGVNSVAIADDGRWLATGSDDRTVRVWDPATGEDHAVLGHTRQVEAVTVTAGGARLVTLDWRGTVRTWDTRTWQKELVSRSHGDSLMAATENAIWIAASSGHGYTGIAGTTAAVWRGVRSLRARTWAWDPATGKERTVLRGRAADVTAVAVAPDGTWIATGDTTGAVRIWDAATGNERAVVRSGNNAVYAMAVAPDGTWLVTGSADGTTRVWDSVTGELRAVLVGHAARVEAAAVAPDGTWLVTGSADGTTRVWDTTTGEEQAVLPGDNTVQAIAVAPDGSWLVTGSVDGTARIWDAASWGKPDKRSPVSQVQAADADGTSPATDPGMTTAREPRSFGPDAGALLVASVTDQTAWLVTESDDGLVHVWDALTGGEHAVLNSDTGPAGVTAIAADGRSLAISMDMDEAVQVWDVKTGDQRSVLRVHVRPFTIAPLVLAPNGTWLAAVPSNRGRVQIYDTATGKICTVLRGKAVVGALAIAPDGTWLAVGGWRGRTQIWNTSTWRKRVRLRGHSHVVLAMASAPDGTWLATICWDQTVRIWDTSTWRERAILGSHVGGTMPTPILTGAAAVSPGGAWLATSTDGQTVRIWDTSMFRPRALMRIDSGITSLGWLKNDVLLAGSGQRGVFGFDLRSPEGARR
jgi:WD40 repeat protein